MDSTSPDETQAAILSACSSGDLSTLQHLLHNLTNDLKTSDSPKEPQYLSSPSYSSLLPRLYGMLAAAITNTHPPIISFLLQTYPTLPLSRSAILQPALAHPHEEVFKTLLSHDPSIITYEFENQNSTILMEACRTSSPLLPRLLIAAGADVRSGGFPGRGPLFYAISFGQPREIVEEMVEKGAGVSTAVVREVVEKGRVDVLVMLLGRARREDVEWVARWAREKENKSVLEVLKEYEAGRGSEAMAEKNKRWDREGR